jgi:hypothetical protein
MKTPKLLPPQFALGYLLGGTGFTALAISFSQMPEPWHSLFRWTGGALLAANIWVAMRARGLATRSSSDRKGRD